MPSANNLRIGNPADKNNVPLFASEKLEESGSSLLFDGKEVLTEGTSLTVNVVSSLPEASSELEGVYFLLLSDSLIRKCVEVSGSWEWTILPMTNWSFSLPLVKSSAGVVSISGINTETGSEARFLTEKGTFQPSTTITIDAISKNWFVNGSDTGVRAEGSPGPRGYHFTPGVSNGILTWTNNGGLENPDPVNIKGDTGQRGTRLSIGTAITGGNASGMVFPSSGIEGALIGDLYLNSNTFNLYRCLLGGEPQTARWGYLGCLQGAVGPALSIDATGALADKDQYDNEDAGFIFLTNDGWLYRKNSSSAGDWSTAIQFKGDQGEPFHYSDFTPEQLESLKGEKGDTPVLTIDPVTKHWRVDGVDMGVVAEGTGQYSPGAGIAIYGSTISVLGADSTSGDVQKFLNQKGEFTKVARPALILSYDSTTGRAVAQPIDPATGLPDGSPVTNLILDWGRENE